MLPVAPGPHLRTLDFQDSLCLEAGLDYATFLEQFFPDGDLLTQIKKYRFTLREKINMCTQVSSGLLHLHALNILHGDLALR